MLETLMFWKTREVPCDIPTALQSGLGQSSPQEKLLDWNLKKYSSCMCTVITNSHENQKQVMGFLVGLEERGQARYPIICHSSLPDVCCSQLEVVPAYDSRGVVSFCTWCKVHWACQISLRPMYKCDFLLIFSLISSFNRVLGVPPICECQSKYLDPQSLLALKLNIEQGKKIKWLRKFYFAPFL